jgi:DNA-binding NarL/FixJ family response regulator
MRKDNKINIAIVDDSKLTLLGWEEKFKDHPDINIVFTSLNKESFWKLCDQYQPILDVLILDKNIDGKTQFDDFNYIEDTRKKFPNQKIIVYTWDYYTGHIEHLRECKISGYLPSKSDPKIMLEAILSVMKGNTYFPDDKEAKAADKSLYDTGKEFDVEFIKLVSELSPAQNKVAALLAHDYQNQQIADKLNISIKSVEKHISSIYIYLNISSRKVHARSKFNHHYGNYFRQKYTIR